MNRKPVDRVHLKNAELQAKFKDMSLELADLQREMEIDISLDRVPASAIAVQASDDVSTTTSILFQDAAC